VELGGPDVHRAVSEMLPLTLMMITTKMKTMKSSDDWWMMM
jgi:hypothetical protein